jgi:TolB protein
VSVLALACACSQVEKLPSLLVQGGGLFALGEDGTRVELLAADTNNVVSQPNWAPDSTFAVWTEFDPTENVARIAMGNGDSQRRIDGGTIPFFYGFSPDGKTIAYLGNDPAGGGVALGLLDVASGAARLIDSGQPYYFDWAADSAHLLVHANQADTYFIDLEGEKDDLDIAPGVYQAPTFLSEASMLAVENGSLVAIDIDSGDRLVVADVGAFSQFSVAGEQIAFTASDQFAPGPLSAITVEGNERTLISGELVIAFEWSPDGEFLYYLELSADGLVPGIWNGAESRLFAPILPTAVFLQNYLPFWDQYTRFHTLWAADSSGFYFPRGDDEIAFYPVDEGEPRVVAQGVVAFPAPG